MHLGRRKQFRGFGLASLGKVLQSGESAEQRLWKHVEKLSRKVWNQNQCGKRSVGQRQTGEVQIVAGILF